MIARTKNKRLAADVFRYILANGHPHGLANDVAASIYEAWFENRDLLKIRSEHSKCGLFKYESITELFPNLFGDDKVYCESEEEFGKILTNLESDSDEEIVVENDVLYEAVFTHGSYEEYAFYMKEQHDNHIASKLYCNESVSECSRGYGVVCLFGAINNDIYCKWERVVEFRPECVIFDTRDYSSPNKDFLKEVYEASLCWEDFNKEFSEELREYLLSNFTIVEYNYTGSYYVTGKIDLEF